MHWKSGVLLRVLLLMSLFWCSQTEFLGQTGSAASKPSTKKNDKKQTATKPAQPPKKVDTPPAAKPSPAPKPNLPAKPNPAPTPTPQKETPPAKVEGGSSPSPNEVDMGVREVDIACPFADYKWESGQRRCSDPRFSSFNNAEDIAKKLDQAIAGLRVRNIDEHRLLISWKGKMPERAVTELERLIEQEAAPGGADPDENRVIRLYNSRNASKIAEAINGVYPNLNAGAAADDVIFLKGQPTGLKHAFSNVDRLVARLDLPRPEVTLNVWSLQMSSKDPKKLEKDSEWVEEQVDRYNRGLQDALDRGWKTLSQEWGSGPQQVSARKFRDYVANLMLDCGDMSIADCKSNSKIHVDVNQICDKGQYCLGFKDSFDLTTRSLTRMLLLLAASDNPDLLGDEVVDAMENIADSSNRTTCQKPSADIAVQSGSGPAFPCFREQLKKLHSKGERLGALRAAYADFLYTYKWSVAYPNEFIPYELPLSASILDSQLEPFMSALNRDVTKYLESVERTVQDELAKKDYDTKKQLYVSGVVSVRAISGLSSEVDTKTASFFDATPPVTVNDVAKNLKDVETNMPAAVQANVGAHAAAALMAGLTAEKPAVARVGRSLILKATPVSLIAASAAELDVTLDATEDSDSQVYFKDKDNSKQVDDTSRVAQHTVSTHVRVESMKLFELSSFSASLRRKNRTFPLLPPFVELPYVGNLLRLPLASDPTFHRSFAVASAIVVPTAADLALGIPFIGDRKVVGPRHEVVPSDLCLYDPEPLPKPKGGGSHPPSTLGTGESADAPKEFKDKCDPQNPLKEGKENKSLSAEKMIVHRLSSSSELDAAVRPYHKKLVDCFKSWKDDCEGLSFKEVESEER